MACINGDGFCAYSTQKYLKLTKSHWLCSFYVVYMIACLGAIVAVVVWTEEYNDFSSQVETAVSIKVYGTVRTNFSKDKFNELMPKKEMELYNRLWDPADYVFPSPQGQASEVFITTNLIQKTQSRYLCPAHPELKGARCNITDPNHCQGSIGPFGGKSSNGILTGKCVALRLANGSSVNTCEVEAWCPMIMADDLPLKNQESLLRNVSKSILVISTSIRFPLFNYIPQPEKQFRNYELCDPSDPHCPPFCLEDIVTQAQVAKPIEDIYKYGAVIALHVNWDNCTVGHECSPVYYPMDLGNPESETFQLHTYVYTAIQEPSIHQRTLVAAHGVRLIVLVSGTAKQFNYVTAITSGIKYGSVLTFGSLLFSFLLKSCYYKDPDSAEESAETNPFYDKHKYSFRTTCAFLTKFERCCPCCACCTSTSSTGHNSGEENHVATEL